MLKFEPTCRLSRFSFIVAAFIFIFSGSVHADGYIADHTVSKESVLRSIPESAIEAAKQNLHIAYFHSSHGSRVITGMDGLKNYKSGDDTLFDFSKDGVPQDGKLDIDDHSEGGNDLSAKDDLESNGHTLWFNETVTFIEDSDNADINVVMWSWCDPAGHDHLQYIDDMEELISRYGINGSRIGTGDGKTKETPVIFVFMTGHPNGDGESTSDNSAYLCHTRIKQHCEENNRFLLDYWDIETHGMDDTYYPYADDNGTDQNQNYEFYMAWQNDHPDDYFTNSCAHCSEDQDLTCNRKAYAAWWLWARIAGWGGEDGGILDTDGDSDNSGFCFIGSVSGENKPI